MRLALCNDDSLLWSTSHPLYYPGSCHYDFSILKYSYSLTCAKYHHLFLCVSGRRIKIYNICCDGESECAYMLISYGDAMMLDQCFSDQPISFFSFLAR
jgi:hypothetical protein